MTDYRLINKKTKQSSEKEDFFNNKKTHSKDETKQGLISKKQESDELVKKHKEVVDQYRPDVVVKDPKTFAFFGSAKKYYQDAFYNIVNFYPYDGPKKEVLEWFQNAKPLEVAMLQNHWPGSVGHLQLAANPFVSFYAGPASITEETYVGRYLRGTGLDLDASVGNTVEFWLNKKALVGNEEVVFDIGTYPNKVSSDNFGQFKLFLSTSAGSPFFVSYLAGTKGVTNQNIGSQNLSSSAVDSDWHHYALRAYQQNSNLKFDLYVDGEKDSTTTVAVSGTLGKVNTYMGGCIGAQHTSSVGSLSGSIDEFRFWKGQRTAEQISRNYDQTVFASEIEDDTFTSRLGLYYKFNKPILGETAKDEVVVDYSGHEITGLINNYGTSVRVPESAITLSTASENTEVKTPSLDDSDPRVKSKKEELDGIASVYDDNNSSTIKNLVPNWVFDANGQGLSNPDSEVSILLQLVASEFDSIKMSLDAINKIKVPTFQEASDDILNNNEITSSHKDTIESYYIGCDDDGEVYAPTLGNNSWFSISKLENIGISAQCPPLSNATIN